MKAILMTAAGEPAVLEPGQLPTPALTDENAILVRLKAAGVNPVDTKLRRNGTYFPDRMPAILGCDGAGIVESAGAAVADFRPGDEVYFCHGGIGGAPGNYAEYAVVDARYAARKPASLSFVQAAAAPLVLITAWEALYDRGRMTEGQRVLVHAGAGGVGHVAVQLAKAAGCEVFTTVGSAEKARFVGGLGVDHPILYTQTDFSQAVLELTSGAGVDLALDTVGGATFDRTFEAVRSYGDVVTLLQPGADTQWKTARLRNLRISLELMLSPMYYGWSEAIAHQSRILARCARLFDEGRLKVHVSHTLPLEQAADAHRLIEAGGTTGKIVLTID